MSVLIFMSEMHAGRVACCPLLGHEEYSDGTDKQTDGRTPYDITLSARRGQRNNASRFVSV